MSRPRCLRCQYLQLQCICDLIPIVEQPVEIIILQHEKEAKHAKNTVKLLQVVWPKIRVISVNEEKTGKNRCSDKRNNDNFCQV